MPRPSSQPALSKPHPLGLSVSKPGRTLRTTLGRAQGKQGCLCKGAIRFSEPVYDLRHSKAKNAKWTNCKLVLSNLSQFFHKRLFLSNQAKLRSTTQR